MKTMTQTFLSGSDAGEGILVTTAAPLDGTDTTIHAVGSVSAGEYDEVIIYATNNDTVAKYLQIGFGDDEAKDIIQATLPAKSGLAVIVPDMILGSGKTVTASAETASVIVVHGKVIQVRNAA